MHSDPKHANPRLKKRVEDPKEEVSSQEESDSDPEKHQPTEGAEDSTDESSDSDNPRSEGTGEDQEESKAKDDKSLEKEAAETVAVPRSKVHVTSTNRFTNRGAAHTMAPKESIVITDKKGNPIQPEQPPNCPQQIEVTATQCTNNDRNYSKNNGL